MGLWPISALGRFARNDTSGFHTTRPATSFYAILARKQLAGVAIANKSPVDPHQQATVKTIPALK